MNIYISHCGTMKASCMSSLRFVANKIIGYNDTEGMLSKIQMELQDK